MLVAARKFSLGESALEPGDVLTDEMVADLPPNRLETLKTIHFISEKTDRDLEARVAELEARISALEKPRTRKAAA